MADDPKPDPNPEDAEKAFWEKFDTRMDAFFERKLKTGSTAPAPPTAPPPSPEPDPKAPGKTRMDSKRVTLPSLIADMVFGPPKEG